MKSGNPQADRGIPRSPAASDRRRLPRVPDRRLLAVSGLAFLAWLTFLVVTACRS